MLYNLSCPAGCRDLALPTSLASVDTVLAGHAHYYGWRSSGGWHQLEKGEYLAAPLLRTRVNKGLLWLRRGFAHIANRCRGHQGPRSYRLLKYLAIGRRM